jgi:hypothetical protein
LAIAPRTVSGEQPQVDAQAGGRRVRGAAEHVDHLAEGPRPWIDEVEALAVLALRVREMIERGRDVVDRHEADPAALDADHREPCGHVAAQLLDGLEQVVGPVDLVHLAGGRVADHHRGAVDAPGPLAFAPHQRLGIVLGAEVGMLETAGLLEHRLVETAIVEPGGRDRADQVQAAGVDRTREAQHLARALDVGCLEVGAARREVVDRRQVEQVRDAAAQAVELRRGQP